MDKQRKQAIKQMILAAFMCAAVVIPGMVAVNAATAKEQAKQAEIAEQMDKAMMEKIADVKSVVETTPEEQPEQVQKHWDSIPLDAELQKYIVEQSEAHGIQPEIIVAMIKQESNYKADDIGDNGNSFGLMQIQVRWHYKRMLKLDCTNLLDPYQNVTVGIDYLAELLNRYDGDMAKALTAYNKGHFPGYVTEYARDVMEKAGDLTA